MLSRPPACCQAVRRQLFGPSDSVWITNEALRNAFKRFVVSRTGKRYGSFVPGPLESRRRLGKRRMAHLTEHIPTSATNLGPLWGFFGDIGNTQWQWEAPTVRKPRDSSAAALPPWLVDWDTGPQATPESIAMEDSTSKPVEGSISAEEDILNFRRTLQSASPHQVLEICDQFNRRLEQSLRLGLVPEATIRSNLSDISEDICIVCSKSGLDNTPHLLSFYHAFWEGLVSCKVLRPIELQASTLGEFLFRLGQLPICTKVQTLIYRVMHAASAAQLSQMHLHIVQMMQASVRNWLQEQHPVDARHSIVATTVALSKSSNRFEHLTQLVHGDDNQHKLSTTQTVVTLENFRQAAAQGVGALDELANSARRALGGCGKFRRLLSPNQHWPEPDLSPDENKSFEQQQKLQEKIRL